jgi:excisionase family DNA binding protein
MRKLFDWLYISVMVNMKSGDWISPADAARLLGVSRDRVYALIRNGRLQTTKLGVMHLLLRSDVDAFAKKPRTPGRPAKVATKKKGGKK